MELEYIDGIYHYVNCIHIFNLFLLNYHTMIANGVFLRDLCLLRKKNIVVDDQDYLILWEMILKMDLITQNLTQSSKLGMVKNVYAIIVHIVG